MEAATNNDQLPPRELLRLIDANLNRLKEGIRVIEDIQRYGFDNADAAKALKYLRHQARTSLYEACLESRDADHDVLRPTLPLEEKRDDLKSLLIANFKRAQESARVLEESLKLYSLQEAEIFKEIRYRLYSLEKTLIIR